MMFSFHLPHKTEFFGSFRSRACKFLYLELFSFWVLVAIYLPMSLFMFMLIIHQVSVQWIEGICKSMTVRTFSSFNNWYTLRLLRKISCFDAKNMARFWVTNIWIFTQLPMTISKCSRMWYLKGFQCHKFEVACRQSLNSAKNLNKEAVWLLMTERRVIVIDGLSRSPSHYCNENGNVSNVSITSSAFFCFWTFNSHVVTKSICRF